ncbi:ABC transporter ATP-binding protein [Roseibacillus ishigakijimensis]|uniref:ABC transporter ATP-binding protein n=1 Tax=Roseibacillus ishigakijimensis TaxID=454146 RepID=A0A934RLM4_9BACT|nr:ABC transporter ATP-binding protein [Roseibacillus ishigakijimensis]MBK1833669.1 ABC transporter ATP-binding protein [Roseibacillus ishigakijimensis]
MFAEFRPLFPHLKPLIPKFLLGLAAGVLYGVATGAGLPLLSDTALPLIFQNEEKMAEVPQWFLSFNEFVFGGDLNRLLVASCFFIPFVFLLRAVGGYFSGYFMNEVGIRAIENFRCEVFERLLKLPLRFYGEHASGDLLSRVLGDTRAMQTAVTKSAGDTIKQPMVLVFAFSYLVSKAIEEEGVFFALVGGITVPLLVFPIRILGKRLKKRSLAMQEKTGVISGITSEVIQNPLEVRAYNLESQLGGTFGKLSAQRRNLELRLVRYRSLLSPIVEVVAAIGFAFSLYLGAQKGMGLEDFLGMATALFMTYEPIKKLGQLHGVLEQAKASMNRVRLILDSEDELPDPVHPQALEKLRGEVRFEEVRFSYGAEEILKGVSLSISPGETVALVGESGGGKTTFVNLIPRFFEATSGAVRVDGYDVRTLRKQDLRAQIALVPQMPVLFRGTIRENILMGRPGATEAEVEEAARLAFAHDFILRQEKGYDTEVSEKGSTLSGGQRQRIAIARAFLKDAPILIMDEATSALDAESEEKVREALAELSKGRTTIVITHRESTLQAADRVFVFEKGVVREGGADQH